MKKNLLILLALIMSLDVIASTANATDDAVASQIDAIIAKEATYKPIVSAYFKDAACTELKDSYKSMSDEDFWIDMVANGLPERVQDLLLPVKQQWSSEYNSVKSERFRIQNYNLYPTATSTRRWENSLYADFNGPTGIVADKNTLLGVFVGDDVPANTTLSLVSSNDAGFLSDPDILVATLKKGMNLVRNPRDNAYLWIMRTTADNSVKVSEQSPIKIHIEGGYAMGYAKLAGLSESEAKAEYSSMITYATGLSDNKSISQNRVFPVMGNASELLFSLSGNSQRVNSESIYSIVNNFDALVMSYHNYLGIDNETFTDYIRSYTPVFISADADLAAYQFSELILQLGAPDDTEAYSAKIEALKSAYSSLTEAQKQMIDPTLLLLARYAVNTVNLPNFKVTLNTEGLATLSYGLNLKLKTEGISLHKAAVSGETITLTKLEDGDYYIPAGNGVVLQGNSGYEVEFETPGASDEAANMTGNALKATTKADGSLATMEPNSWALKGDKFLKYTPDTYTANKAYLVHDTGSDANTLHIVFADSEQGNTTVIETVKAGTQTLSFDLYGRIANDKGLRIKNGTAVFVK